MSRIDDPLREACAGLAPLDGRLDEWQRRMCADPMALAALVERHGSPLNLIHPGPMARNAGQLADAAAAAGVRLDIHFARKANKALALVDAAARMGLGVDLASEPELEQVLSRGLAGGTIVMTAAVKPASVVEACIRAGALIVVDNHDELRAVQGRTDAMGMDARVALRLCPDLGPGRSPSRFGFELADAVALTGEGWPRGLLLEGVHFHIDGYSANDRVRAIGQALDLVDAARGAGHPVRTVDIGGGVPMSYLDDRRQWDAFWRALHRSLAGLRLPMTFEGHALGLSASGRRTGASSAVYPFHQDPVQGRWLALVLSGRPAGSGTSVGRALAGRGLTLGCEPGRSLLDGCGMTAGRVVYRKRRRDGAWLIGLEMNRTQCRSTSEDYLVDPLLLRSGTPGDRDPAARGPIEGFLVGAYCIERELLTWRRLRFPSGVAVGDLVVWPNTAGYLMHIVESASHGIPLARNLIVGGETGPTLDPIDDPRGLPR